MTWPNVCGTSSCPTSGKIKQTYPNATSAVSKKAVNGSIFSEWYIISISYYSVCSWPHRAFQLLND